MFEVVASIVVIMTVGMFIFGWVAAMAGVCQ